MGLLHLAVKHNQADKIDIQAGADVTAKGGCTPIMLAANTHTINTHTIKLLFDHGGCPDDASRLIQDIVKPQKHGRATGSSATCAVPQ